MGTSSSGAHAHPGRPRRPQTHVLAPTQANSRQFSSAKLVLNTRMKAEACCRSRAAQAKASST